MTKLKLLYFVGLIFICIAGCDSGSGGGSTPLKKSFLIKLDVTNRGLPAASADWKYDVSNDYVEETVAGLHSSWFFESAQSGYFVEKIGKATVDQTPDAYIGFDTRSIDKYNDYYDIVIFSSKSGGALYEMRIQTEDGYQKYLFEYVLDFAIAWIQTYPENNFSGYQVIDYY